MCIRDRCSPFWLCLFGNFNFKIMNNTFNIGAMDTVYPFIPMYLSLIHI